MKKKGMLLLWLLILGLLTGCTATTVESGLPLLRNARDSQTMDGIAVTQCSEILANIWGNYRPEERFLVYGGDSQNLVADGPGDLDVADTTVLQRFFLTEALSEAITEGAALEHLLNRNVFCAGVFRLTDKAKPVQMAVQWKEGFEQIQWTGSQPQRYLIAQPEQGFLLLAYGQTRVLETFLIRMNQAYPQGKILMYQEIPQKISPQNTSSEAINLFGGKILDPSSAFDNKITENRFQNIGKSGDEGNDQNTKVCKMAQHEGDGDTEKPNKTAVKYGSDEGFSTGPHSKIGGMDIRTKWHVAGVDAN